MFGNFTWDSFSRENTDEKSLGGPPRFQAPLLVKLGYQPCLHTRITRAQFQQFQILMRQFISKKEKMISPFETEHLIFTSKATIFKHIYVESGARKSSLLSNAGHIPLTQLGTRHFKQTTRKKHVAIIISPVFYELLPNEIISLSKKTDIPLYLDPQGFLRKINPNTSQVVGHRFWNLELFNSVDVIKISEEEMMCLCPPTITEGLLKEWNASTIHKMILKDLQKRNHGKIQWQNLRPKMIIVTKGAKGAELSMTLHQKGSQQPSFRLYSSPSFPTKVKNPTGAGDAFLVGFIHGWHISKNIESSLALANAMASFQISEPEILFSSEGHEEIERRMNWIHDKIIIDFPLDNSSL